MKLRTKLIIAFVVVMIFPVTFALIAMHAFVPGRGAEIQQLYLIAVVLTTAFLILWIYRSVSVPLEKLQRAARNIKEGNLDFEIKAESNDEIGQLCQDFEEMRLRLKAQAEEKVAFDRENKELISNISHDLKTPITAVKGYVEGIMDGVANTPEKMDRYIRTIYNKANEMDRLINELTFYSKIDTNRIPYTFSKIHIADYFDDCVEELNLELDAQHVDLTYFNYLEDDPVVIADAEQLAAEAFGAAHAFLMVGGTTSAVQSMVLTAVKRGEKIILPRNVHRSVMGAMVLGGAVPVYVNPAGDKRLGIPLGMRVEDVRRAIKENPDAKAVFVNNPTYYGICSDLRSIVKLAHEHGMLCLVDEAHGTHFYFGENMPVSAMAAGADMAAVSMHKSGGSLTQSSILLTGPGMSAGYVRQIINLTQTTSGSYLLLSSLDISRRNLALRGREAFKQVVELAEYARRIGKTGKNI